MSDEEAVTVIELGCCAFIFGRRSLEDGLRLVADLGFRHADVSAADIGDKAQVDQQEAAVHPGRLGRQTRELAARYELALDELFVCPVFVDGQRVEVNDPDEGKRKLLLRNFDRLCAYAAEAGFASIMGVPGVPQEALRPEEAWDLSVEVLSRMVQIASRRGMRLNVEPHAGSIVQDPRLALKLAQEVPGLTYTLDYSHFISLGYKEEDAMPLHACTQHMHARQARPGAGGCVVAEGTIDFAAIVKRLLAEGWEGVIAMEYFAGREPVLRHSGAFQNLVLAYQLDEWIEAGE
jgi:sugar phosphate isomerase/epimerase